MTKAILCHFQVHVHRQGNCYSRSPMWPSLGFKPFSTKKQHGFIYMMILDNHPNDSLSFSSINCRKQCFSAMHDWRNLNNASFESIMVILYDEGKTTVIHHPGHAGTWSQHSFVSGVRFSGTHCILVIVILRDR